LIVVSALIAFLIASGIKSDYQRLTVQDKAWVKDRFDGMPWN